MNEERVITTLARIERERAIEEEAYQAWISNGHRLTYSQRAPLGFDMGTWYNTIDPASQHWCRTTACFAGHAVLAQGMSLTTCGLARGRDGSATRPISGVAQQWLGLSMWQAGELFHLPDLNAVYNRLAEWMGVAEQVLRDKVADEVAAMLEEQVAREEAATRARRAASTSRPEWPVRAPESEEVSAS